MADTRRAPERRVLRVCERHRCEDQLLALAYEHIRPVICKRPQQNAAKRTQQHREKTSGQTQKVRSA